jgi:hypothetical protein
MTATTGAAAAGTRRVPRTLLGPVRDAVAIAGRNLIAYRRVPQLLVFSTIQPVIFVLLFRYVFGGAVQSLPGVPYVDYLMPGIFVQTTVFGAIGTAIGLATDLKSGLLERFRSLPMARSAVLAGRTLADLTRNVFVTPSWSWSASPSASGSTPARSPSCSGWRWSCCSATPSPGCSPPLGWPLATPRRPRRPPSR